MRLPEKFTINSQEVTIEIVDTLPDSNFGQYGCITDKIKIATHVIDDEDNVIPLKEEQIWNTLFHEIIHCFQWHSKGEYSEEEANTYAGYLIEFFKSSGLKFKQDETN